MKKLLFVGVGALLAGMGLLRAQEMRVPEDTADLSVSDANAALAFEDTSAARVNLLSAPSGTNMNGAFGEAAPPHSMPALPATPPGKPTFVFGDRDDYRWQLGLGVEFLRFRSSLVSASMVGTSTTLTYFTNDWFGIEGDVVTGFAPAIYQNDHVKYVGASGGAHIGARRARWEPWAHALFGFGHLQPQLAGNTRNSLSITAGGGVDYRLYARFSLRAEADYVYTRFFSETQNNFQGAAGVVFHF